MMRRINIIKNSISTHADAPALKTTLQFFAARRLRIFSQFFQFMVNGFLKAFRECRNFFLDSLWDIEIPHSCLGSFPGFPLFQGLAVFRARLGDLIRKRTVSFVHAVLKIAHDPIIGLDRNERRDCTPVFGHEAGRAVFFQVFKDFGKMVSHFTGWQYLDCHYVRLLVQNIQHNYDQVNSGLVIFYTGDYRQGEEP